MRVGLVFRTPRPSSRQFCISATDEWRWGRIRNVGGWSVRHDPRHVNFAYLLRMNGDGEGLETLEDGDWIMGRSAEHVFCLISIRAS
ncbi:hypothetical protein QE152_g32024 [Popillia japonica]|uniref:Uncharacterized protein n=1 Tax=Popillia japonica TaxID=7064 RepID=A0AAW1J0T5_POPJA